MPTHSRARNPGPMPRRHNQQSPYAFATEVDMYFDQHIFKVRCPYCTKIHEHSLTPDADRASFIDHRTVFGGCFEGNYVIIIPGGCPVRVWAYLEEIHGDQPDFIRGYGNDPHFKRDENFGPGEYVSYDKDFPTAAYGGHPGDGVTTEFKYFADDAL